MDIKTPLVGSVASGFTPTPPEINYSNTDEGLKNASKDFVSILFSYMFETMRGDPDNQDNEDGVTGSLFGGENMHMFLGFLDQEMGKKFSEQGGKDMVDALYHQLKGDRVFEKTNSNNVKPEGIGTTAS